MRRPPERPVRRHSLNDDGRLYRVARVGSEASDVQFPDIRGTRTTSCRRESRSAAAQQETGGRHGGQRQQSDTKASDTHLPVDRVHCHHDVYLLLLKITITARAEPLA